jgi:hypothetical protein
MPPIHVVLSNRTSFCMSGPTHLSVHASTQKWYLAITLLRTLPRTKHSIGWRQRLSAQTRNPPASKDLAGAPSLRQAWNAQLLAVGHPHLHCSRFLSVGEVTDEIRSSLRSAMVLHSLVMCRSYLHCLNPSIHGHNFDLLGFNPL